MRRPLLWLCLVLLTVGSCTTLCAGEIMDYIPADTEAFFKFNNFDAFLSRVGMLIHEVDDDISADMFSVFVKQLFIKSSITAVDLEKEIAILFLKEPTNKGYKIVVAISIEDYNEFREKFSSNSQRVFANNDAEIELLTRGTSEFYILKKDKFVFIGKDLPVLKRLKDFKSSGVKALSEELACVSLQKRFEDIHSFSNDDDLFFIRPGKDGFYPSVVQAQ